MSIVEFEGSPFWPHGASETWESTKCPCGGGPLAGKYAFEILQSYFFHTKNTKYISLRFSIEHCCSSRKLFNRMSRITEKWKSAEKSQSSDACRLCGINFKISVCDFGRKNK